jgi:hypothetical protein
MSVMTVANRRSRSALIIGDAKCATPSRQRVLIADESL